MANTPEKRKDPETPSDVRKLMTEFDPNKLISEFQNMLKQYKLPGVDIEAWSHRRRRTSKPSSPPIGSPWKACRRSPSARRRYSRNR